MTETPDNVSPEPVQKDRKIAQPRKKAKQPFEQFLAALSGLALVDNLDASSQAARILNNGFVEELKPEHVDRTLEALQQFKSLDRLALRMLTANSQRRSPLWVTLRNRFRSTLSQEINYPIDVTIGRDRSFELSEWIKLGDSRRQPDAKRFPDSWVRKAFFCLSTETNSDIRISAVHRLTHAIVRVATGDQSAPFQTDVRSYLREVGKLLVNDPVSAARIATALQFGHPYEDQRRVDQESLSQAQRLSTELADANSRLEKDNALLRAEVKDLSDELSTVRNQLRETDMQLNTEIERHKELTGHREKESEQKLARQRHSLQESFSHDLQEARLCLDRDTPNIAMALRRIRQMEEVIQKLESAK